MAEKLVDPCIGCKDDSKCIIGCTKYGDYMAQLEYGHPASAPTTTAPTPTVTTISQDEFLARVSRDNKDIYGTEPVQLKQGEGR